MVRTVLIIGALVGIFTWFLTGQAPQRSGTLALQLALDFPPAAKADLGRTVARILPVCPGFGTVGGEVIFNNLSQYASTTRMTFTVPEKSRVPKEWGPYDKPCAYEVTGDELRIMEGPCQALCLGKRPEKALDMLVVSLPAQEAAAAGAEGKSAEKSADKAGKVDKADKADKAAEKSADNPGKADKTEASPKAAPKPTPEEKK